MADLDRQVSELNAQVPAGAATLPTAEMVLVWIASAAMRLRSSPQTQVYDHAGKQIWPPPRPVFSTTISVPIIQHAGPRWHETLEAEAQQRRIEWEKVVADHERRAEEHAKRQEEETQAKIEADHAAREAHFGPTVP